jgi:predicted amidohydrolase
MCSDGTATLRVGLTQWHATIDVVSNLNIAVDLVRRAAENGADLVVLPENGLCLGTNSQMRDHAIRVDGPELGLLADAATGHDVAVVLGGFKRIADDEGTVTNSAVVLSPGAGVVGVYDKIHLFDANVGGVSFEASTVETAGARPTVIDLDTGGKRIRLGLTICYDVRFPELYRRLALEGAEVFLVPAAFTHVTGSAHWEVLLRARAIENLGFVVASATIRGEGDAFETYGHALVVSPWGEVIATLGTAPLAVQVVEIDLSEVAAARARLPVLAGHRPDAYRVDDLAVIEGEAHVRT